MACRKNYGKRSRETFPGDLVALVAAKNNPRSPGAPRTYHLSIPLDEWLVRLVYARRANAFTSYIMLSPCWANATPAPAGGDVEIQDEPGSTPELVPSD